MTRIFNFIMLLALAGIYYAQNGGFDRAEATVVAQNEPAAASATMSAKDVSLAELADVVPEQTNRQPVQTDQTPVLTASLGTVASDAQPETPALIATTPKINPLSQADLDAIEARFLASRLAASTVIREVETDLAAVAAVTPAQDRWVVTGSVVNARSAPTTSSQVLAKLKRGTQVLPTGNEDGSWREITVIDTGETVWMHRKFLKSNS